MWFGWCPGPCLALLSPRGAPVPARQASCIIKYLQITTYLFLKSVFFGVFFTSRSSACFFQWKPKLVVHRVPSGVCGFTGRHWTPAAAAPRGWEGADPGPASLGHASAFPAGPRRLPACRLQQNTDSNKHFFLLDYRYLFLSRFLKMGHPLCRCRGHGKDHLESFLLLL